MAGFAEYVRLVGEAMPIVMESVAVSEPARLVAIIVYVVEDVTVVGVPVITPEVVLNVNPDVSEGEIEYEETAPPCDVGVFG